MGGGSWSTSTYDSGTKRKIASGTNFAHSGYVRRTGDWKPHETLDPKAVNKNGPHTGQNVREAYDNDDHPESNAIVVFFDVTGSMGGIPRVLQEKLPKLHGLLLRKGYITDPQILFGAFGDANCDHVPLQVGQFESDNRMDEHLDNLVLEGGGGGQVRETSELALYFAARHTDLDCLNKRGKKGYMFLITDEMAYDTATKAFIQDVVGGSSEVDVSIKEIIAEVQDKYELFHIHANSAYGSHDGIKQYWKNLLGERSLFLEDAGAVCELIGSTIGILEGTVDLDGALDDLKDVGTDLGTVDSVGKSLATVGAGAGSLATASGDLPEGDGGSAATRI